MDTHERRRDVRTRLSLPTCLVVGREALPIEMVDASYRGLFLRMDNPPPVNQLIQLRIELPIGTFKAHAVVVRIVGGKSGRAGVGARLFALNGSERADWERVVTAAIAAQRRAA